MLMVNIISLIGCPIFLLGLSNKTKKAAVGEKTTIGTVEDFDFATDTKVYPTKYQAIIKSGNRKYKIESYTMPWLKKGEEVKIQSTGKQRVLGNERLNIKGKIELLLGGILLIASFLMITI